MKLVQMSLCITLFLLKHLSYHLAVSMCFVLVIELTSFVCFHLSLAFIVKNSS